MSYRHPSFPHQPRFRCQAGPFPPPGTAASPAAASMSAPDPPRARTTSAYTSGGHDDRPGADAFSPLGHRVDDGTTGVPSRPALPPHEIPGIRHPRTAPTTGTPPPQIGRTHV